MVMSFPSFFGFHAFQDPVNIIGRTARIVAFAARNLLEGRFNIFYGKIFHPFKNRRDHDRILGFINRIRPEARAIELVRHHRDKSYSLCDAYSFVVMHRLRIADVIAFDRHFREYGKFAVL